MNQAKRVRFSRPPSPKAYSSRSASAELVAICRPPVDASAMCVGEHRLAQGHRGEYKIGRTNLVDRPPGELGAMAPIEYQLVHEIKTDDPAGVESSWHELP